MKPAFSRKYKPFRALACLLLFLAALAWFAPKAMGQDDVTKAVTQAKESGVPEETLNRVLLLGYKNSLKPEQLTELLHLTRAAKEHGFPPDQAVSKMEEGLAKRVQVAAIQRAVKAEMTRHAEARAMVRQTMGRRGQGDTDIPQGLVARLANTLAMGLSAREMQGVLEAAPKASLNHLATSLEFMAALQQANIGHETAREIALQGLENNFFAKDAWSLAQLIQAAKIKNLPEKDIKAKALEVVKGQKSVTDAQKSLGVKDSDMARGPVVGAPAAPGPGAAGDGAGGSSGGAGSGSGGGAGGGAGGAGGGAGGPGSGPGGH